ncbi:MAG: prepilin-type N-terminal cleavage/methylation domain-containing protein [bacterium]
MLNLQKYSRKLKGFTLIELLVTIAIIALLASILFPVFGKAREKARQATCQSNLKQISTAMMLYAQDWEEMLPFRTPAGGPANYEWDVQLMQYFGLKWGQGNKITSYYCPSSLPYPSFELYRSLSYAYNRHVADNEYDSRNLTSLTTPSSTLLIVDMRCLSTGPDTSWCTYNARDTPTYITYNSTRFPYTRHSNGVNVLFADGHVAWCPPSVPPASGPPKGTRWWNGGTLY